MGRDPSALLAPSASLSRGPQAVERADSLPNFYNTELDFLIETLLAFPTIIPPTVAHHPGQYISKAWSSPARIYECEKAFPTLMSWPRKKLRLVVTGSSWWTICTRWLLTMRALSIYYKFILTTHEYR